MPNLNQSSTRPLKILKKPIVIIAILSLIGFADAAYLTASDYFSFAVPCSVTLGCETVLKSVYATIGPIPVALIGVFYYLTALIISISIITSTSSSYNNRAGKIILGIFSLGFLASGYFVYLQIFIIKSLCLYCLISALISLLLFISSVLLNKKRGVEAPLTQ